MKLKYLALCAALALLAIGISYWQAEAGTTGVIQGSITDLKTGSVLPGVNVSVVGTRLTTVTDANGHFVITNVPPGTYDIVASLVGYKDVTETAVPVEMDVTSLVELQLSAEVIVNPEAVVTGSRLRLSKTVTPTMYVITPKEEKLAAHQPNNLYQLPGVLLTLPGVVADPNGYATIRGGDMWYVGYLIEGIPISEPITNGFVTNTVTAGLSKAELFTGGYKPEYGNALAGVVNQVIKTGDSLVAPGNAMGWTMDGSLGTASYRDINLEYGGKNLDGATWYGATYLWRTDFPGNNYTTECPYSRDVVGKLVLPMGKNDTFTLLALHGQAKYEYPGEATQIYDPVADDAKDIDPTDFYSEQSYSVDGIMYNHSFSANSFYNLRLFRVVGDGIYNTLNPDNPFASYRERHSNQRGIQFDYANQLNSKHLLKFGGSLIKSDNLSMKFANTYVPHEHFVNDIPTVQTAMFVQDQFRPNERMTVDYGLRYEKMNFDRKYNPDLTNSQISPRFGMAYSLNDRTLLRSSYGKFIMFPPTSLLESHFDVPEVDAWYKWGNLEPERASTLDFGIERKLNSSLLLRATAFSVEKKDLINYTYTPDWQIQFVNGFKGRSKGMELMLQAKPKDGWNGWVSYTYMKAKASTVDSPDFFTRLPQDQRHSLALVATKKFRRFEISPYIEYGSGYPYGIGWSEYDPTPGMPGDEIPVIGPDGKPGSTTPNTYSAGSHLSLSVLMRIPMTRDSSFYVAVQNLLNSKAVTTYSVNTPGSYHLPTDEYPNGYLTYEPYQKVPPRFIRFGYSYQF